MFLDRHWNRAMYPTKHILICDDDTSVQARIAHHLYEVFGFQGIIQCSFVSGGRAAAGVILWTPIDLIILDHDMPNGNGSDLLQWLQANKYGMPVITFSGLIINNTNMMKLGATYEFQKEEVITGKADSLMKTILGI